MFAAWLELLEDDAVVDQPAALRVYARLLRNPLILTQPQDTKVWVIALEMHANRETVSAALDLLVERGYVIEHPRGPSRVRRLTIPEARQVRTRKPIGLQNRHSQSARRVGGV